MMSSTRLRIAASVLGPRMRLRSRLSSRSIVRSIRSSRSRASRLLLLARSVPVNDKSLPQMIGTHSTFDNVEDFFIPVRPLAQDLLPAHIASKHGLGKGCRFGTVLGNDGDKKPAFAVDRAQVLLCAQLAVGDVNEVRMLQ